MAQYREGQTATNPKTGQKIRYEGGFWVAVEGSGLGMKPPVGTNGFSAQRLEAPDAIAQRDIFKRDYGTINDARENLGRYSPTISQLDRFEALNVHQRTGGIQHQDMGGWNPIQNINEAMNPNLKEMSGIASGLQGQARPKGSGATSDFEQRLYRMGVPSPEKTGPVNQSIIAYQKGVMMEERERLAFQEAFLTQNGTLSGSQDAWANYVTKNPYTVSDANARTKANTRRQPWRQYFGLEQPKVPAGPVNDLSGLKIGSPEYRQALARVPMGATYRDPEGNVRRNENGVGGNPIIKKGGRARVGAVTQGDGWKVIEVR